MNIAERLLDFCEDQLAFGLLVLAGILAITVILFMENVVERSR